ncbi:MAG: flagellar hook-basal body protein [Bacillota bacterium]
MLRGMYNAASGLNQKQRELEVAGHNIANVSTTGFKSSRLNSGSFPVVLLSRLQPGKEPASIGQTSYGTQTVVQVTRFDQGPLESTGSPMDVALMGDGFLVVDTANGERYFRGGTLYIDSEGYLATVTGDKVLGDDGPIEVPTGKMTISPDGGISVDEQAVGKLQIVEFAEKDKLVREGHGYFSAEGTRPDVATATVVQQGYLEASNVDLPGEMTRLIEGLRAYQLNQRALRTQDEMLSKAVNQVGKVR